MTGDTLQSIELTDSALWGDVEQLRTNSKPAVDEDASPAIAVPRAAGANIARAVQRVNHDAGIGTSRPSGFA